MAAIQLPAHLAGRTSRGVAERAVENLGTGTPPYVSIAGNRFTLIDQTGAQEPVTTVDPKTGMPFLECCIIDAGDHESKIYFGHDFDPSAQSYAPPKCWSDNGVAPSMNASEPQARSCTPDPTGQHGCRLAVWGSATSKVTGKGIPACGKYQKLALALPGDDVVFLLRVPPNSLDALRTYLLKFRGTGIDVSQVITRISFEGQGKLGTLTFIAPGAFIDAEMVAFVDRVYASKGTDAMVGRLDKPIAGVLPAPAPVQQIEHLPAPSQAPTPAFAQPQAPPVPQPSAAEPARRRGRPPKTEPAPAGTAAPFASPAATAPAPNGGFGIQANPAAPDAELAAGLKGLFG